MSGWLAPSKPPENPVAFKAWEQQGKVDRLRDLIPFWRDGVSAAEKGREVAKMEDFLHRLDEEERNGIWQTKNNGWGKDLGEDVWGPANRRPDARGSRPSDNGAAWDPAGPGGWNTGRRWGSDSGHGWEPPAAEQGWSGVQDNAGWGVAAGGAVPRSEGISPRSEDTSASAAAAWHEGEPGDSWTFVEEIARQEAASHERRRDMHEFYAVSAFCVDPHGVLLIHRHGADVYTGEAEEDWGGCRLPPRPQCLIRELFAH